MAGGRLRVICGPTAAGKSSIALELAKTKHAAIISADSRQVYREFDVGTAKPTREQREIVPHFGIDVVQPVQRYSAAQWARDATGFIQQLQCDTAALVTGGTGLYIRALVDPIFNAEALPAERRSDLERELSSLPLSELRRWCSQLDPARGHLGRTQLLRAIETVLLQGGRISAQHAAQKEQPRPFDPVYLLVDPGPALGLRIEQRIDQMLGCGWLDEVQRLARTIPPDAPAWKASGYRTIRKVVENEMDLSSARERVIIETRQYAKRQRTWFRHQLPPRSVTRLNPDDPDFRTVVQEWWEKPE
ncbi:MAG: tRNA (adenosine(37)-N6)-dimethylallyltransferase MiaA [Gemmatimonadaceae bacterium]